MNSDLDIQNLKKIMEIVSLSGKIMLKSGAEIFRVEDTVHRILDSIEGIENVNVYVVPDCITVSTFYKDHPHTYIFTVSGSRVNLDRIAKVNEFSRRFVRDEIKDFDEAISYLTSVQEASVYRYLTKNMISSLACGFFSLMLGGGLLEFIISSFIGFSVVLIINELEERNISFFLVSFIGAFITGLFAYSIIIFINDINLDSIIIGSIMLLVPGVALTNSIRNTMSGDFVSGLSKLFEVVFAALAISLGVFMAYMVLYGGIF